MTFDQLLTQLTELRAHAEGDEEIQVTGAYGSETYLFEVLIEAGRLVIRTDLCTG